MGSQNCHPLPTKQSIDEFNLKSREGYIKISFCYLPRVGQHRVFCCLFVVACLFLEVCADSFFKGKCGSSKFGLQERKKKRRRKERKKKKKRF